MVLRVTDARPGEVGGGRGKGFPPSLGLANDERCRIPPKWNILDAWRFSEFFGFWRLAFIPAGSKSEPPKFEQTGPKFGPPDCEQTGLGILPPMLALIWGSFGKTWPEQKQAGPDLGPQGWH